MVYIWANARIWNRNIDSYVGLGFIPSKLSIFIIYGFTLYNAVIMPYSEFDLCISHSDYSALRSLLGYAPISLNENEYIVHCFL